MTEYLACFAVGAIAGAAIWVHAERKYRRLFFKLGMQKACDLIAGDTAHSPSNPLRPTRLILAISNARHYADKL